jgi:hypothetical protein
VVLLYAQRSEGGRGPLYSELTLGVWSGDEDLRRLLGEA